jgi:carbon storage regulator CsrA
MLAVTLKVGERLTIGDGVTLRILHGGKTTIRLGVEAPPEQLIRRTGEDGKPAPIKIQPEQPAA